MKYCCLLMVVLVLATLVVVEAKKKPNNNKFEGDFEFVDEVSHKLYSWSIGSKENFKNLCKKNVCILFGVDFCDLETMCVCVCLKGLQIPFNLL